MKSILSIAACAAVFSAAGFSHAAWLEKRGDDSDVLRLQAAFRDCEKKVEAPAENVSIPIDIVCRASRVSMSFFCRKS